MFRSSLLPVSAAALTLFATPMMVQARSVNPTRTITVAPGYGVTVIPAFPVYKLWIDDGSRLGVDFDRPPEEGATILHVYQSSKSSSTFSNDGSTMMTLVSADGQIQKIAINFTTGKIQDSILDLSQSRPSGSTQFAALNPAVTRSRVEVLRAGLRRAIAEGSIQRGGQFNQAIDRFLGLLEGGQSLESASQDTGVMLEVIGKLAKMGVEEKGYQLDIPTGDQLQVNAGEVQRVTFTLKDFAEPTRSLGSNKRRTIQPDVLRADEEVRVEELLAKQPEVKPASKPVQEPVDIAAVIEPDGSDAIAEVGGGMAIAKQLERGFSQLVKQGEVKKYSQVGLNIQNMIGRVKWGESPRFAAEQADVEAALVAQLLEYGQDAKYYDSHGMANAMVRGLAVANRTGEIGRNARLSWSVQDVIWRLRKGWTLEQALAGSGVTESNADRLLQLGEYKPL